MVDSHGSAANNPPSKTLERHARGLDTVLRELRKRARHRPAPHLIARAIDSLDVELAAVRRQLGRR